MDSSPERKRGRDNQARQRETKYRAASFDPWRELEYEQFVLLLCNSTPCNCRACWANSIAATPLQRTERAGRTACGTGHSLGDCILVRLCGIPAAREARALRCVSPGHPPAPLKLAQTWPRPFALRSVSVGRPLTFSSPVCADMVSLSCPNGSESLQNESSARVLLSMFSQLPPRTRSHGCSGRVTPR